MISILTEKQTRVLEALATYKFLTVSQFKQLGIDQHNSNLRRTLKPLLESKRPLIDRIMFTVYPQSRDWSKRNKLEYWYFLKPRGKQFLINHQLMEDGEIRLPIGTSSMAYKDYYHRKNTINCHISLNQNAAAQKMEVLFFDTYFDKTGNNRTKHNLRAKTKIDTDHQQYLIADAIFMLQTHQQPELYCLELENGRDSNKAIQKLKSYVQALVKGSPSLKYDFPRGNRVLFIFEQTSTLQATIKRMQQDPIFRGFERFFLFKALDDINKFFDDWCLLTGEVVEMF